MSSKHYEIISITDTNQTEYLLPYYHFLGSELSRCGSTGQQTLILDFALRTVRIEGSELGKITKKLQNRTIKTIPEESTSADKAQSTIKSPDKSTGTDNQPPIITRIDVVCRGREESMGEMP